MKVNQRIVLITAFAALWFGAGSAHADEGYGDGFKPIFDGKTLNGWKPHDAKFWSVEDGAITAESTPERPGVANEFIVWDQGRLDDFELKLSFRITGSPSANSGIQIRSSIGPDGHLVGYQADIDMGKQWLGMLYDEHARGVLAFRGQDVTIEPGHQISPLNTPKEQKPLASYRHNEWNHYHIIASDNKITLKVNGETTAVVTDNDPKNADLSGVLAMQLHSGPPMKVQFKNIMLKRLPLSDGRKKAVLVAGAKSHAYGSHDHKAGCMLLADRLNTSGLPIYATVYYPGYPSDPTAFDNADTIVFYCDGGQRHPANPHLDAVDARVNDGAGVVCIHYGVETTKGAEGEAFLRWIGGYFEQHWSVNPWWEIRGMKLAKDHPITRGVRPFQLRDEFYYHMRFRDGMSGVTPIVTALPPASTLVKPDGSLARPEGPHTNNPQARAAVLERHEPQHVAWASENAGESRGFGFTGAHVHWNWANDDFRKMVLNAIAWTAKIEVPADGVPSKTPTLEEMLANHDEQPNITPEQVKKILEQVTRSSLADK